jgi:hypothetical protein
MEYLGVSLIKRGQNVDEAMSNKNLVHEKPLKTA